MTVYHPKRWFSKPRINRGGAIGHAASPHLNPYDQVNLGTSKEMSFKDYLENLMKSSGIEIAQRKFDGKFNVWQKVFELDSYNAYSEYWQVIAVANSYRDAQLAAQNFQKSR